MCISSYAFTSRLSFHFLCCVWWCTYFRLTAFKLLELLSLKRNIHEGENIFNRRLIYIIILAATLTETVKSSLKLLSQFWSGWSWFGGTLSTWGWLTCSGDFQSGVKRPLDMRGFQRVRSKNGFSFNYNSIIIKTMRERSSGKINIQKHNSCQMGTLWKKFDQTEVWYFLSFFGLITSCFV